MNWHTLTVNKTFEESKTSAEGLSPDEARRRLKQYGPNSIEGKKKKTAIALLLAQFTDFMILVLIAAAVISGFIGEISDTIAIIIIVALNAVIGFVQEYRAEKAMEALKKMSSPTALVRRDGQPVEISATEIVPGDIVLLEAGRIVPADLRLIQAEQLKSGESAITGESVPVDKTIREFADGNLPLGDRLNIAYKGTTIVYGRGAGVAIGTGMNTELGKIASMIQGEKEVKTPLQKRLADFGSRLAIGVLVICAIVFVTGILRGEPALHMLLTAISLAVAAIPEALPAVVTISLALGARKLVGQNALIRKLPAVETLGSVTYICSDKTGTLTLNQMTVEEVFVGTKHFEKADFAASAPAENPEDPSRLFLQALAVSTDASRDEKGRGIGDPTEIALYDFAKENHCVKSEIERHLPRVAEIPFDSERKLMTTFHEMPDSERKGSRYCSFTKGAIDMLLIRCKSVLTAEGESALDENAINRSNDEMTSRGLRVLAFGVRFWDTLPEHPRSERDERDLNFLGLVGLIDPPREEAAEAVATCKTAGIRPVMITGDHPGTARAIAERLGIIDSPDDMVVSGPELAAMSIETFEERIEHIKVYARVAPEQKLKVLKGLQDKGHFAAMTGDGVNDAPALKRADIGIAMGITGTDVSKEAAHMILLDDNFATIVKAVKEGRRIFDNIRKFIRYTMTSNSGEIWTIFLAPLFGLPIPLLPIHILWINLVTDGLPGLALAAEPAEKGIMDCPPRRPNESIFAHGMGIQIIWVGLLMGLVSLFTEWRFYGVGDAHWRTMVFTVLCFSQMGNVLAIRSERRSLFSLGLFSNKPLLGAFVLTVLLQLATIYVPFLNPVFKTGPLSITELGITLLLSSIVFFAVEIDKLLLRIRKPAGGRN